MVGLTLSTDWNGGAPILSRDLCRFRRSSLDRLAWPSCCSLCTRACCSLSSASSRRVSGIKDVRPCCVRSSTAAQLTRCLHGMQAAFGPIFRFGKQYSRCLHCFMTRTTWSVIQNNCVSCRGALKRFLAFHLWPSLPCLAAVPQSCPAMPSLKEANGHLNVMLYR